MSCGVTLREGKADDIVALMRVMEAAFDPAFGEAWNRAQVPAPTVTLDPATRGITGLDTRISTAGPATVTIAATIRGYTITGTATLDGDEGNDQRRDLQLAPHRAVE